jgi:hypothetical protein
MATFVQFADGIIFEVDRPTSDAELRFSKTGDAIIAATTSFRDVLEAQIRPMAQHLVAALREVSCDEVTAEFGIKITGEAGAVFAKAGVEGSIDISLKWNRSRAADERA